MTRPTLRRAALATILAFAPLALVPAVAWADPPPIAPPPQAAPPPPLPVECDPTLGDCGPEGPRPLPPGGVPVNPYPYYYTPYAPVPRSPYAPAPHPDWLRAAEPRGHHEIQRRWGLMGAGLGIFGGIYTFNLAGAAVASEWRLALPAVGPMVYLAKYREKFDCSDDNPGVSYTYCATERSDDKALYVVLALDFIIQLGGLAMTFAGAFTKHKVFVRDNVRFTVLPKVQPDGGGLFAVGTF